MCESARACGLVGHGYTNTLTTCTHLHTRQQVQHIERQTPRTVLRSWHPRLCLNVSPSALSVAGIARWMQPHVYAQAMHTAGLSHTQTHTHTHTCARTDTHTRTHTHSHIIFRSQCEMFLHAHTHTHAASQTGSARTPGEHAGAKMPEPVHKMDDAPVMLATRLSTSPPLVLATDLFETGYEAPHVMLDEPLCPCPAGQKLSKVHHIVTFRVNIVVG